MYYKLTKIIKAVRTIFEKIVIFFLCELPLILGVAPKRKEETEDICMETPDIEFEQDWSVGLDATLRERQKI